MPTKKTGITIQSVVRAVQILDCFEDAPSLGISEIAAKMGLSKSTVYGLVNTLSGCGLLEQDASRNYHLGLKLFELGNKVGARMDIRREARPYCEDLADKYPATVHLAVFSGDEVIYIDKVDRPKSAVVVYSQIGKRAPMYCTGVGKAILANLPMAEIELYLQSNPLVKVTDRTITTKEALLEELNQTRNRGYAMDNEEIEPGLSCIAAPIFDYSRRPCGAVSISFPFSRIGELDPDTVAQDVMACAKTISVRMGYAAGSDDRP